MTSATYARSTGAAVGHTKDNSGREAGSIKAESSEEPRLSPELKALAAELGQEAPVDLAKVNRIRAQLEAGTYQADPETIAARLLELDALLPAPDSRNDDDAQSS